MTNRRYIKALEKRLVNPSDFDTNIICLKEFAECVNNFMTVAKPHFIKKFKAENDSEKSYFSFFRDQSSAQAVDEDLILAIAKEKAFGGSNRIELSLEGHRIIDLNSSESFRRVVTANGQPLSFTTTIKHTITFSDQFVLTLTDFTPQSLAKARIQFREKMEELAAENTPTFRIK